MDMILIMGFAGAAILFCFIIRTSLWDGTIKGYPEIFVARWQIWFFWTAFILGIGFAYLMGYIQANQISLLN